MLQNGIQFGQAPTAVAALGLVVGLIWLCARFARSSGLSRQAPRGASGTRLVIEDSVTLDRVRRLYLVRCAGRELVLLTGGGCDQLVPLGPQGPTPEGVVR